MACILKNSNEPSRKKRLIYKCNLSFSQFNHYKNCLADMGLLRVSTREDGKEIFETSQKGKKFLKDYRNIKSILDKMHL